jgi:hypothetical protein
MSYISAKRIGKELGLSYHKVNEVLAANDLYDKCARRPTSNAIENGLAMTKSTISQFTGKSAEFNVWHFDKLKSLFQKTKKVKSPVPCRSPEDAFDRICGAFADFGDMLKIKCKEPRPDISPEAHAAVVQSYFSDPDYLDGPLLFHGFMNQAQADAAKSRSLPLAKELHIAARRVNASRAHSNLAAIETTLQWLCDKAH